MVIPRHMLSLLLGACLWAPSAGCLYGYDAVEGQDGTGGGTDGADAMAPGATLDGGARVDGSPAGSLDSGEPEAGPTTLADYRFEDDLTDRSGNGFDGQAVGTLAFVDAPTGRAIQFSERAAYMATDELASVLIAPLQMGEPLVFTMVARVRIHAYLEEGAAEQVLASLGEKADYPYEGLRLSFHQGELRLIGQTGFGPGVLMRLGPAPTEGEWTDLAVVVDADQVYHYVDGQLVKMTTTRAAGSITTRLQIGGLRGAELGLNGDVAYFQFYSDALTGEQIRSLDDPGA